MKFNGIKAIIFDVDGVLVDNIGLHYKAWSIFCGDYGLPPLTETAFREKLFGKTNHDTLEFLFQRKLTESEVITFSEIKERLYRQLAENELKPLNGLVAFLDYLKKEKIPFGIASSGPRINIDFILKQTGLSSYFKLITDASQVSRGKPDPEVFLITSAKLGVEPEKCLVFEDSFMGIEAAQRAGMQVVGVATTYSQHELPGEIEKISDFTEMEFLHLNNCV